jgi:hypothetical protein
MCAVVVDFKEERHRRRPYADASDEWLMKVAQAALHRGNEQVFAQVRREAVWRDRHDAMWSTTRVGEGNERTTV